MASEHDTKEQHPRVEALDILRLIAALAVVMFHFGFNGPSPTIQLNSALPETGTFAKYGFLGVPLFFVISGFVIAYSAEGRSAMSFAIARVTRIYPGFLFCMTVTFIAVATFGAPYLQADGGQWAANLLIAAPALNQPYMDSVYWTIVSELTFYGWVCLMIAAGQFRRRIDLLVLIWLVVSVLNEEVLQSFELRRVVLTHQSGYFAAGLLLYEIYSGRRDAAVQCLFALAIACSVSQAVVQANEMQSRLAIDFDEWIVATVCLFAIMLVGLAVRVRRLPLPPKVILAMGGLTYPLYLLHQNIGYIIFKRVEHLSRPSVIVAAIIIAMIAASWTIWRYVERPGQRLIKRLLSHAAARLGWVTSRSRTSAALPPMNDAPYLNR